MKELILVGRSDHTPGEFRTLNIYQQAGQWCAHWEDDDTHYGATHAEVRAAAYQEAAARWPGYLGPWNTREAASQALRPADLDWAQRRMRGQL